MAAKRTVGTEVLRLAIDGEGVRPETVPLHQLAAILDAAARLLARVAEEEKIDMPHVFLREVESNCAAVVLRSTHDLVRAKKLATRAAQVMKTGGKDSGGNVARALGDLVAAVEPVGTARVRAHGQKKLFLVRPPAESKLALEVEDEIHVHVAGVVLARGGVNVTLRPLHGGTTEAFFSSDPQVRISAVHLFDQDAIAHVVYRQHRGDLRASSLEKLESWAPRDFLAVIDDIRKGFGQRGLEVDVARWLGEID